MFYGFNRLDVRIQATVVIWLTLAFIATMGLVFGPGADLPISDVLLIGFMGAAAATIAIWLITAFTDDKGESAEQKGALAKAKRSEADRLALLLELMDEDERSAFKDRLKREVLAGARLGNDGEIDLPHHLDDLWEDEARGARTSYQR